MKVTKIIAPTIVVAMPLDVLALIAQLREPT
jgi:hypothetical protein